MPAAPVAVVGGGHNGLICAAYLARAGVETVVFEARPFVGGCAATVDALGARVNICNCDHILVRSTPVFEELELERHGLRYLDSDPVQVAVSPSGARPWFLYHDPARTIESLLERYPRSVDGYKRYLDAAVPAARLVVEAANEPPTLGSVVPTVLRRGGRGVATLLRWSRQSVAGVMSGYFDEEPLRAPAGLAGAAVAGLSPATPGTGLGALAYAIRHVVRAGRPVGGSGALTDALARAVEGSGGSVRVGMGVREVHVERGRARRLVLTNGDDVAVRAVVVACDPRVLDVRWEGGEPPPNATPWFRRVQRDGYQSKVDAIVSQLPRYRDADVGDDMTSPTAVVAASTAALAEAHASLVRGAVPEMPPHLVNVPSVLDATMRLPSGDHVLSLETLYTPYAHSRGWSEGESLAQAETWLERYAALLEPGFLEGIRAWRIVTPLDYERDLGQPRGGAQTYGGSPLAAVLGRDRELTRYETPIAGLFLAGVAAYPGGGIWGAPGRNAASVVARRLA